MRILVTGAAGFIGFHLAKRLCERGDTVIGIDNLNDYYDVSLKEARLNHLASYARGLSLTNHESRVTCHGSFEFIRMDIADRFAMEGLFRDHAFDRVVHLAAQAGVRYSVENPYAYIHSNIVGFMNILEGCRQQWCSGSRVTNHVSRHLVYASSSSVYGLNTKIPFSVRDNADRPVSLYGATKRADELMAHAYSHLYGIPTTGLRFFTVYGPWGRPDMSLFKFTRAILADEAIDVFNQGNMSRDFTYIDDIVEGVVRVCDRVPSMDESRVPCRLYNIGNHRPVNLLEFVRILEKALGKKARMNFLPMQCGDMQTTYADVDDLMRDVGFAPNTRLEDGIRAFVDWYLSYYEA